MSYRVCVLKFLVLGEALEVRPILLVAVVVPIDYGWGIKGGDLTLFSIWSESPCVWCALFTTSNDAFLLVMSGKSVPSRSFGLPGLVGDCIRVSWESGFYSMDRIPSSLTCSLPLLFLRSYFFRFFGLTLWYVLLYSSSLMLSMIPLSPLFPYLKGLMTVLPSWSCTYYYICSKCWSIRAIWCC